MTAGRKIASVASVGYHNAWANVKQADLEALRLLIEGGDFKSVAQQYFPLEEAAKAFALVKAGTVGKVIVTVKEDKGSSEIEREFAGAAKPAVAQGGANNNNNNSVASSNSNVIHINSAAPSPSKRANESAAPVARERDLGADDYEDEPSTGNPFSK